MGRIVLCLTLLVSVAACETSTDPFIGFGGTPGITQSQADGNWSFTVQQTSTLGCTTGSLANGQVLTATMDVLADGTLAASTSFWQNPPTTVVRPLSGSIILTSGFTDLFMAAASGSALGKVRPQNPQPAAEHPRRPNGERAWCVRGNVDS